MRLLLKGLLLIATLSLLPFVTAANKKPPVAPVNLNTATSEELQTVPGIGPATAEKILQMRKNYGAFKSVDDLLAIKGIGPKRLEKMRKYLTVGKTGSSSKPAAPGSATKPSDQPAKPAPPPGSLNPGNPSALGRTALATGPGAWDAALQRAVGPDRQW